jgi:hypothetical protein
VRSYRDLWLWLGGLLLTLALFLAAAAIAYFSKEPRYSLFLNFWMIAACVAFVAAFASFFAAIRGWSFPPGGRPKFPDIAVEIYGTGFIDTEREAGTGLAVPTRLRSFNVRISNAEAEQSASLTVLLYVKLIPGSWGRAGEFVCPPPEWTLPPSLNLSPVTMPIALPPGSSVGGSLIYEIPRYYLDKIAEPMSARLELWDRLSGRRMNLPAEIGNYDRTQMIPSSGEIETLGPEHEAAIVLEPDVGQPQP